MRKEFDTILTGEEFDGVYFSKPVIAETIYEKLSEKLTLPLLGLTTLISIGLFIASQIK